MKIEHRYLILPVSRYAKTKRLIFTNQDKIRMEYDVQLCTEQPEDTYYVDMRFARGEDLEYRWEPEVSYVPRFTDTVPMAGVYAEKYRPAAHFTASRGWINDPNGLVYANGIYHLFFQHNPAGPNWGNMHWGHALSTDLLHWEETEIALFPDELGTMYSGNAVVDTQNRTGLKENENDVILLYYTACPSGMKLSSGHKTSQCLAYSADGGETFQKYAHNPIIPHITGNNRDPKVVYAEEENCYYMALYLDGHTFALFASDTLLTWEQVQTISLPEDDECPNFYPLTTQTGRRLWVLAGAHDTYRIGRLQNGRFVSIQEPRHLHYGRKAYAAQTYSGIPEGRIIRFSWNQSTPPNSSFNCSMTTPNHMTLQEDDTELYLCIQPIAELSKIAHPTRPESLSGKAHDITLNLSMQPDTELEVSLLGFSMRISAAKHYIHVQDCRIPLYDKSGNAKIRLITDTTSIEIYSTDGKAFGVFEHIADYDLNAVRTTLLCGQAEIKITANTLESIWTPSLR